MPLNLKSCNQQCRHCVLRYKAKHDLKKGDTFDISCKGVPSEEVLNSIVDELDSEAATAALSFVDPVTWAAANLDWHCIDPDGMIWKRKNPNEFFDWVALHPGESIEGNSRYHRPYQAELLRCTSKYKIARIGRQAGKTESLVIEILFNMFTKPGLSENDGFRVILITPFQSQIELIFGRIEELIDQSSVLKNSIQRYVKSPNFTMELKNGSSISGFTAGTRSGGNAASVRGQHGHMLAYDETDYLAAADIDATMSIVTNFPSAKVWMSSTPTGRRERFYDTCFDPMWRDFHYPSQVNPLWDSNKEKMFKGLLTEAGYEHEILAEFGSREEGVFQAGYVKTAQADYEYSDMRFRTDWTYSIGVDWNGMAIGTTILVLGFNPAQNKFKVVDRDIVRRDGWTQLAACNRIAEVNRKWHPESIYVDAGYGRTQVEILNKFSYDASLDPERGINHPDAKIKDILQAYDFSSKVEVFDPFTHQKIMKDSKPFLVESAVRRFENEDIKFPASDEELFRQLVGYIIDHLTTAGRPVYKADPEHGDHTLDALMLAIVAFTIEKGAFSRPTYVSTMGFTGHFGENLHLESVDQLELIKRRVKEKNDKLPSMQRTDNLSGENSSILEPSKPFVAPTNTTALWAWPGFMRDEPAPASSVRRSFRVKKPTRTMF